MNILRYALLLALAAVAAGTAAACPDPAQSGEAYTYTSDDLWTRKVLNVTAGGGVDLGECLDLPGLGRVIERPDFTLRYNRTQQYNLRFTTSGACDTVLLINDAAGTWHFDDDSSETADAEIWLNGAADGYIDVWIGTFGEAACEAELSIEAFK